MAREGTRSATGNSKPRVFNTVDTGPTIKRSRKPKTAGLLGGKAGKTETKVAPKKKGPAKQAGSAVAKVRLSKICSLILLAGQLFGKKERKDRTDD
jgi:hypothetical protein